MTQPMTVCVVRGLRRFDPVRNAERYAMPSGMVSGKREKVGGMLRDTVNRKQTHAASVQKSIPAT